MDVKIKKSISYFSILIGLILLVFFCISSFHYKSLVIHPVSIWHGANLGVRSLVFDKDPSGYNISYNKEILDKIGDKTEPLELELTVLKALSSPSQQSASGQGKNRVATYKVIQAEINDELEQLDSTRNSLLNSLSMMSDLNDGFSSLDVYQQSQIDRNETIADALDINTELPTEEQANELFNKISTPQSNVSHSIPEKVLINVQQSTGISPEEINELMRK